MTRSIESNNKTSKTESNTSTVKVKYRGIEVNPDEHLSSIKAIEDNTIVGKYRGLPIKSHSFPKELKLKKKTEIKYRGIPLETDDNDNKNPDN